MYKNRILISESDRRNILGMYGLINEATTTSVNGTIVNEIENVILTLKPKTLSPLSDITVSLADVRGIEVSTIATTKTDENGKFSFDNVPDSKNIILTVPETELFFLYEKSLKDIKVNTTNDLGNIILKPKKVTPAIPPTPTVSKEEKCEGFVSDDKNIYGYGTAINKPVSSADLFLDTESVKLAKRAAVRYYIIKYPNPQVGLGELLNEKIPYEIVCTHLSSDFTKPETTNVIKIEKKVLDDIVQNIINRVVTPEKVKIKFEDLNFIDAVRISYVRNSEPLFLLFGSKDDESTQNVINYIEANQEMTQEINESYIPLFYEVDRTDVNKYMPASEPLGVRTYPSIVILKGIDDPTKQGIKNSIEVIGKEERISDNLTNIDNLIK